MQGNKFVLTKSNLVADVLKQSGFTLVSHQNDTWTFMNDGRHTFSQDEKKEAVFTDKLFL